MEYTSYEIFEVGSKTACQTRPVYPRGRTIMIHWMNTLFVLRNLFPVKRFCAINLAQQHIFPREVARTIVCLSKSHLPSIKNHSFKSIFSVSEKATMSGCGAENSSILDNLQKSVKEQVCIYIFLAEILRVQVCISSCIKYYTCNQPYWCRRKSSWYATFHKLTLTFSEGKWNFVITEAIARASIVSFISSPIMFIFADYQACVSIASPSTTGIPSFSQ